MDLFSVNLENRDKPLSELLRPKKLDDYLGNEKIVGPETPLYNIVHNGKYFSAIFWGPPGSGKTSLARIISQSVGANFIELSAVSSGLKELRAALDEAKEKLKYHGQKTIIFLDEIHHYNKTQQDAILHDLEAGYIYLIGATTENPSFQVIPALLSRLLVIRLQPLTRVNMQQIIDRATKEIAAEPLSEESADFIINYANGDARSALNLLELAFKASANKNIELTILEQLAQQSRLNYGLKGDAHFDCASAYQKSMRGSDPDAALYWLGKMLVAGEDPRFVARRLLVTASEDVGLADPMALVLANAAFEAVEKLGMPEARIPLAEATAYIAKAPKSNKAYSAINKIMSNIAKGQDYPVPMHLRDSHYRDAQKYGHGQGYKYSHNHPGEEQQFLPDELKGVKFLED